MALAFITSGSSWSGVTSDGRPVQLEGIGGGGAGGGSTSAQAGSGGGGGAYAIKGGIAYNSGSTVTVSVPAAAAGVSGADGTAGSDSNWNSGVLIAKGGAAGKLSGAGVSGGAAASCTPTTGAFSGGSTGTTTSVGSTGGAAAGGPLGAGGGSGTASSGGSGASGGGGTGGNTSSSVGFVTSGTSGGNGSGGAAGGSGGALNNAGGAGSNGSGGGGSGHFGGPGGAGGAGIEWDASHGAGGGAGGGADTGSGANTGTSGALYGGGGAGGSKITGSNAGGNGGPGILVVTYTTLPTSAKIFITDPNQTTLGGFATDPASTLQIDCIGAGGGGESGVGLRGAGGGEHRTSSGISYTAGTPVTGIQIGLGGIGGTISGTTTGADGTETHWNTNVVIAKGGKGGYSGGSSGGTGGTGTTGHAGGAGGSPGSTSGGSGGGGAGGTNGVGATGGSGLDSSHTGGAGGGGNGGGTAGSNASAATTGANGGNNSSGSGHGTGASGSGVGGATVGGGGGGGQGNGSDSAGGDGGTGNEFDSWHGSGGGGGGGGGLANAIAGGKGGLFGGGGGGGGYASADGGRGANGLIVVTYTPPQWIYYQQFTTDSTQCGSSDSTNFPVLVSITSTLLKTAANGGCIRNTTTLNSQTVPADVIFCSASNTYSTLNWEVEFYDGTNGILVAWVQLPTLSHTKPTNFWMVFGNANVSTYQCTASSTWDTAAIATYHLGNGTTLSAVDSTVNANVGTLRSTPTAGTGQIDGCAVLSTGQYIDTAASTSFNSITNAFTASGWMKWSGTFVATSGALVEQSYPNSSGWFLIATDTAGDGIGKIELKLVTANNNLDFRGPSVISAGTWYFVAVVYDGANATTYINGVSENSSAATGNVSGITSTPLLIGSNHGNFFFNGSLDEIRYASVARSVSWLLASYNNQKSSSTFLTADNVGTFAQLTEFQGLSKSQAVNRASTY